MKKTFVYMFIILSVMVFSCSGCNGGKTEDTPAPSKSLTEIVKKIDIYNFFIEEKTEAPSFAKLIEEQYGFEIVFHTKGRRVSKNEEIAKLDGLVFERGSRLLNDLKSKTKKFYVLNEFLKDNEIFNMLPKQYRKSLEDQNGDIWSFPAQQRLALNRRIYNEAIMDDMGLLVPSTVAELIELLQTVKKAHIEDSELKLLPITYDMCLFELKDILEHCGLTINDFSKRGIISWNEKTQRFEDTIYNLNTDLLFDTLDHMRLNSLYSIGDSKSDATFWNNKVFTIMNETINKYKYMSAPFYKHKEYIFNSVYRNIFVPLGNTKPKETLNLFINTFFGSNQGNIYGRFGESGRTVTYDDSFTQVDFVPYDQKILNEDGSGYFIFLVGQGLLNDYTVYNSNHDADWNEKFRRQSLEYKKMLLEKLDTDEIEVLALYKNLHIGGQKPDRTKYADDEAIFRNMLYTYLKDGIGREEFVEEYIKNMKKSGLENYINDKNEIVNADSMFHYD